MNTLDRFRIDGRVALVTGGSRGFGRVIAEALASPGGSVVLTARDAGNAAKAAGSVAAATGAKVLGVSADVTRAADVKAMVAATLDAHGRLDILVNNAGINIRAAIEQLSEDDWDQVIDTNLKGPWLCCRAAAEPMKRQKWGRVINVSSMLGSVGLAGRTPYTASKGGLTVMTRTLALEWAGDGINGAVGRPAGDRASGRVSRVRGVEFHDRRHARHRRRLHGPVRGRPETRPGQIKKDTGHRAKGREPKGKGQRAKGQSGRGQTVDTGADPVLSPLAS